MKGCNTTDYCDQWDIDQATLNKILTENTNARSALFGYLAEEKFKDIYLRPNPEIIDIQTPDDQDTEDPGDWQFMYNGETYRIEVKSLKSGSITQTMEETSARFHIKGSSDSRSITHNGEDYQTTLLNTEKTDLDLIAVNLHRLYNEWKFCFIPVTKLPPSKGNYPTSLREKLATSGPKIEFPLTKPYTNDLITAIEWS